MKKNPSFDPSFLGDKSLPRPIRTGVIGLGRIGWDHHAATIMYHNGFQLCAVCDIEKSRVEEAAKAAGCNGYTDYRKFLKDKSLEAVIIASQSKDHERHTLGVLKAGLHAVCEKPACRTPGGLSRLIATARENGCLLTVHHNQRIFSDCQAVREVLKQKKLGKILRIHRFVGSFSRRNDWQVLRKNNGGLLNNWGTHIIDQTLYLAESPPENTWANLRQEFNPGDTEDDIKTVIRCRNGIILDIDLSYVDCSRRPGWVIQGNRGTLWIQDEKLHVRWLRGKIPALPVQDSHLAQNRSYGILGTKDNLRWQEEEREALPKKKTEGFYDNLYRAIRQGKPLLVTPESALITYQTLAKIRKAASH